ncbi:MAG: aminotransferase class III-fold pyridoxal phosphate-dependent enzyme, partial [Clostridia bacterium]
MAGRSTDTSRRLFERARDVMVEGVSSPSRGSLNYGEYPLFLRRGEGAYVEDVDGNRYVDLMMAYGALLLGHQDPVIRAALHEAADSGTLFAAVSEPEVEVAELIAARVPGVERVRFANTGTEATMAALRLARGLTGRRRFIKFEGHYHGWYDDYLVSAHPHPVTDLGLETDPVPIAESSGLSAHSIHQAILVPWNDLDRLEDALRSHRGEVACIIT